MYFILRTIGEESSTNLLFFFFRQWNIEVTQFSCDYENLAPQVKPMGDIILSKRMCHHDQTKGKSIFTVIFSALHRHVFFAGLPPVCIWHNGNWYHSILQF